MDLRDLEARVNVQTEPSLEDRLNLIERLLGVIQLDKLPTPVAWAIERAYVESRYDWPTDDPLRVAMLAHLPTEETDDD